MRGSYAFSVAIVGVYLVRLKQTMIGSYVCKWCGFERGDESLKQTMIGSYGNAKWQFVFRLKQTMIG